MHEIKHLIVVGPAVVFDSVKCQCVRRAAATLIQRRDEPGMVFRFLQLFCLHVGSCHDASFSFRPRRIRLLVEPSWASPRGASRPTTGWLAATICVRNSQRSSLRYST